MANLNPQLGYVGFAIQPHEGSFIAPTKYTRLRGGSLGSESDLIIPDPEISSGRDTEEVHAGPIKFAGDYEFYFRPESLGILLYATLGTVATESPEAGVYKHTFQTLTSGALPYLSIQEKIADEFDVFNYPDGKINSLSFECEAGELVSGSTNLIATTQSGNIGVNTPTLETAPILVSHGGTLTLESSELSCKSVSMEINNNLKDDDWRIGNRFLGDMNEGQRELTITVTFRPDDMDIYRKAVYGETGVYTPGENVYTGAFTASFESPGKIGSSSLPYRLLLTFAKVAFKPFPIEQTPGDQIEFELELIPVKQAGSPVIDAQLWNAESSVIA